MTLRHLLIVVLLGSAPDVLCQEIDYKGFPQWAWGRKDSTEYYLYTPDKMRPGEKYPVVVVLHGCCGQDYHATLRATVDPLVRMWHDFGANTQRVPTYIIAPKTKVGWSQHIDNLKVAVDDIVANKNGDPQRIYITGFSMGGQGTWQFIERYPDYFAAAIPTGMDWKGKDPAKFKDIPIWTLRGEEDWWARHLGSQVATIRELNGLKKDSSDHITGVNPMLTTFSDMGHVVMWPAASTFDLVGWAYSKVRDGNIYPVAFFKAPSHDMLLKEGENVSIDVIAHDPDGSISKVEIFVNEKLIKAFTNGPYNFSFKAPAGDSRIEAKVSDNQGKVTTATTSVRVNIPVTILTKSIPGARQGEEYAHKFEAQGNGVVKFSIDEKILPDGLRLDERGIITGIPTREGLHRLHIKATDREGDVVEKDFQFSIRRKSENVVVITNAGNYANKNFPLTKVKVGALPHNNRGDHEVSLSGGLTSFMGLTLIQTDFNDTITASPVYMEFETDEPVTVYIAYEKLDNLFQSTVPSWLNGFQKIEGEEIVAQYYYYDVYAKDFPRGKITLPDAEEKKNGVNTNYFVMVKKR